MLTCFMCQKLYPSSQQLISHIRVERGYYPGPKFKLFCSQQGCRHQFLTYAGFRKHLNSIHSSVQQIAHNSAVACSSSEPAATSSQLQALEDQFNPPSQCSSSSVCCEGSDSGLTKDPTKEMCTSIVAKLQGSGISNSLVSSIVGDLEELTNELRSQAKHFAISSLPLSDPNVFVINEKFEKFENPFTNLNTEWKRNKYFNQKWGVVDPVEIILGVRYDSRRNQKSGTYAQVPVRDTFVYLPILETLKFMCRNPEICALLKKEYGSKPDTYTDFFDGS